MLEFGLDTFGDVTADDAGRPLHQAQVLRHVVEQGVLADQVGVDAIGIGEHHRPDFAVSAPDVVLAGIATRTERIRLASAVTVLSSDDPIRVWQRFATIDALSNGRAEAVLGRGSFVESFPLFGYDLGDYETLFEDKLDLFAALLPEEPVTWSGATRAPVPGLEVFPKTESGRLRAWVAVGGTPESVVRAARYGLGLQVAIIGGSAQRFVPLVDLYRRALAEFGHEPQPIAIHSPGHLADTDDEALAQLYPHFKANRDRIGAERGWPPMSEIEFRREVESGALYAGSPATVARKIADTVRLLGADRFDLKYSNGPMPHSQSMRAIELYGTKVAPMVRDLLA